jgi:hypothetical protein
MASFQDAIDQLLRIRAAVDDATRAAANAMPDVMSSVARSEMRMGHFLHTQTPSPPGSPPAWISGALRNSFVATPASAMGDATYHSYTGPTVRYARIQELGGEMTAHNPSGFMWWQQPPGVWHKSRQHSLPRRPYMLPAHRRTVADGSLRRAAAEAFAVRILAVM